MILKAEKDRYVSVDIRRCVNDIFCCGINEIREIPILAWHVNEETGLCVPVLLNGVKPKESDAIIDQKSGWWVAGHDRGKSIGDLRNYINKSVEYEKEREEKLIRGEI